MPTRASLEAELDIAISKAMTSLDEHEPNTEEYAKILDQISKLHKMREAEKPASVSKDTLALIAANLTGIVLVIGHEHANVITTKALSLIMKAR